MMDRRQQQRHSKLVQRRISSVAEADLAFSRITVNNQGVTEIPIVLIPRNPILRFAITIPSGPFVLWQKWHKNMGQLPPGVKWIWPGWCRISHIVSRAINTYNATVRNCPTSDNVLVDFGLSLAFRIGPGIEEAANFVYNLGADLFDELVAAEVEGTVRRLAYTATHDQIDDVQEELSAGVCSTLHSKLATYGVQVMNVTITKVILPIDIRDRLEKIAALKTDMSIREKIHDLRIRAIEDEAAQSTEATRESNERKLKEIEAERIRYDVERRVLEEEARGRARVEEMKAMADADLALQRTRGNEMVGKVVARRQAEALMKKNYIQCQTMRIEAEKKVKIEVKHSETEVVVAESKAAAMIIRAEAESEGADSVQDKRRYELEWEKMKILETFASSRGLNLITGS